MNDDFFADLVGIKPSPNPTPAQNGSASGAEDVVLPSSISGPQPSAPQSLGLPGYQSARTSIKIPQDTLTGPSRSEGQSRDSGSHDAIQSLLERFARGIQQALEDTNRCHFTNAFFPEVLQSEQGSPFGCGSPNSGDQRFGAGGWTRWRARQSK